MSTQDEPAVFELDESIYPLEAVEHAAYALTDRAFVRVERGQPGRLTVRLSAKEGAGWTAERLRGEFDNEALHQVLRLKVSQSNQKIREFIVTKALVCAQPTEAVAAALPPAPAADSCGECAPAAPPKVDEALEKEIDRLLAEIEGADADKDPLGVSVPWEEKYGKPAAPPKEAPKPKAKAPARKRPGTAA